MKKTLWAFLLALPAHGLAAPKKVTVLTDPSDQWPAATRSVMEKAATLVFDRINENDVAQCVVVFGSRTILDIFRPNSDSVL